MIPNLDVARRLGAEAYEAGVPRRANPYWAAAEAWEDAWNDARLEKKGGFDLGLGYEPPVWRVDLDEDIPI